MEKLFRMLPAILIVCFTGCKRDNRTVDSPVKIRSNASSLARTAQEYEDLYDKVIETVAYGIVDGAQNLDFRTIVSSQIDIQFDGDDNALIKTLDSAMSASGISLRQLMRQSLINHGKASDTEFIDYAINGFPYFDGTVFPQIFIPFYEGKNITSTAPTICLNYNDDAILPGLQLVGTNLRNVFVDEQNAMTTNVYVISCNETVGSDGKIHLPPTQGNPPSDPAELSELAGAKGLMIDAINVVDKKEGWGNGRADISFIAITTRAGCNRQPDAVGWPFCKLANRDLGRWFYPSYGNKSIADGYSTFWEALHPEEISIVFFEADRRKKFARNFAPSYCPYTLAYYESKETPYGVVNPYIGNYNSKNYTTHPLVGGQFKLVGWPVF